MTGNKTDLKTLKNKAENEIRSAQNGRELDEIFRHFLGRKGQLTLILRSLEKLPKSKRVEVAKEANALKLDLLQAFESKKKELHRKEFENIEQQEWVDVTAPGKKLLVGHLHPLSQVQRRVQEIFLSMGFGVAQGPEIETERYNFDALNIPPDHPARDMWDTFWLKPENPKSLPAVATTLQAGEIRNPKQIQNSKFKIQNFLLRTHTSPVQIRYMEQRKPPLRIIVPGKAFRYEATDARHEFEMIQVEGLMVDRYVSVANFKAVIQDFYKKFFNKPVQIRLRPSYFPFVEPGFEVDMSCLMCGGKGCASCGNGGWLEMMGAGMVHPNVFKAVGYKAGDWRGFAFGMGMDRLAMMKYKIEDIRLFRSGDLRFLQQF